MPFRHGPRPFAAAAAALAAGALAASVAEDLLAAAPTPPAPLARDEEFVVRLTRAVPFRQVSSGNLRVSESPGTTDARGTWVAGRALIDPATNRAVVVRPEAVREYFQLVKDLPRVDAQTAAAKLLARVERTGNLKPLNEVDVALRQVMGPLAGSRLDDPDVYALYPGTGGLTGGSPDYRRLVAGDDDLWHGYFTGTDINKWNLLTQNPEFERFFHPVDYSTGTADGASVLSRREHRRVLVRRSSTYVTFMPSVPNRADLADSAYEAGATYSVAARGPLRGKVRTFLPARGGALRFVRGLATFGTEPDTGGGGTYLGGTAWTGAPATDLPRIVNITPPVGEVEVDPTTDWETPDNRFIVPIPQRSPPVVRLRFAAPLDPRTVDAVHFRLTKKATIDQFGTETPVNVPVAVGVFLAQSRLGEIRVDMTPTTNLDPGARYEVVVLNSTRSLNGRVRAVDFVSTFVTAN